MVGDQVSWGVYMQPYPLGTVASLTSKGGQSELNSVLWSYTERILKQHLSSELDGMPFCGESVTLWSSCWKGRIPGRQPLVGLDILYLSPPPTPFLKKNIKLL